MSSVCGLWREYSFILVSNHAALTLNFRCSILRKATPLSVNILNIPQYLNFMHQREGSFMAVLHVKEDKITN